MNYSGKFLQEQCNVFVRGHQPGGANDQLSMEQISVHYLNKKLAKVYENEGQAYNDRCRANLIDKMMQNLIDEDKLKRSQQNTWDTSLEYTKKYSFQIQLSMIYLQSRNIS